MSASGRARMLATMRPKRARGRRQSSDPAATEKAGRTPLASMFSFALSTATVSMSRPHAPEACFGAGDPKDAATCAEVEKPFTAVAAADLVDGLQAEEGRRVMAGPERHLRLDDDRDGGRVDPARVYPGRNDQKPPRTHGLEEFTPCDGPVHLTLGPDIDQGVGVSLGQSARNLHGGVLLREVHADAHSARNILLLPSPGDPLRKEGLEGFRHLSREEGVDTEKGYLLINHCLPGVRLRGATSARPPSPNPWADGAWFEGRTIWNRSGRTRRCWPSWPGPG
jgi:hypothetical protein